MIKGCKHWIFSDNGLLASERVPELKFQLCPGPLIWFLGGGGRGRVRLWFWVQLEAKVLSCARASAV